MASRSKKILLGCGIGCGSLILLVIVLVASFSYWVSRPGELLEPRQLLGADTTGYAEWILRLEDPGTERFVEDFLERAQPNADAQTGLPPQLEGLLRGWQDKSNRQNIQAMFPMAAAWTLRPAAEPDTDHHLFTASLKAMGNRMVLADWVLGLSFWQAGRRGSRGDFERLTYGDERIYRITLDRGSDLVFFLSGNDIFFTYDMATAKLAVDSLAQESAAPRGPTPLEELFALTQADKPLRGALTNERQEVFRFWERVATSVEKPDRLKQLAAQLRGATISGGLAGEGTLAGQLGLLCPDAAWAEAYAGEALKTFQAGFDYEGFELSAEVIVDEDWIRIGFRAEGALDFLDDLGDDRGPRGREPQ